MPFETEVLSWLNRYILDQESEINRQFFEFPFAGIRELHPVLAEKLEIGIDPDQVASDPRFLKEFPNRRLPLCFADIQMPLGQIPAFGMTHEEKLEIVDFSKD